MLSRPSQAYRQATQQAFADDAARLGVDDPPAGAVPSPSPAPALTAAEKAQRLRDLGPAVHLYGAMAPLLGDAFDVEAWKVYMDGFLQELGPLADPVARMMAEQLALAHHCLAHLHIRAASRLSAPEVAAYSGAIGRLMAEFRRTALALKAYHHSPVPAAAAPVTDEAHQPSGVGAKRRKKKTRSCKLRSTNRITEFLHEREPALS
jgi:hypothetical protein